MRVCMFKPVPIYLEINRTTYCGTRECANSSPQKYLKLWFLHGGKHPAAIVVAYFYELMNETD